MDWYISKPHIRKARRIESDDPEYALWEGHYVLKSDGGTVTIMPKKDFEESYQRFKALYLPEIAMKYSEGATEEQRTSYMRSMYDWIFKNHADKYFEYQTNTPKGRFMVVYCDAFEDAKAHGRLLSKLVVAVKLPNGAIELITNTEEINTKYQYYLDHYDDDLRLKSNEDVQIINWMFV